MTDLHTTMEAGSAPMTHSSAAHRSNTALTAGRSSSSALRIAAAAGLLGLLSACAGQPQSADMQIPVAQEEAHYRAHAKSYYAPPGPPEDPWGPYVVEAAKRFDVPQEWIRAVMDRESGGRLYHNGELVRSAPGAMGLMQLMPPTYDEMKAEYNLGDDPYDPHDSVLAGTAYIRQMYDIYGSPGFLAAYNAGPGRLEDFLSRNRTLPRETRNYVSAIGRQIAGITPATRSQADLLVASHESSANVAYASAAMPSGQADAVRSAWAHRNTPGTNSDDSSSSDESDTNSNADQPVQVAEAPAEAAPAAATPAYTHAWAPVSHNPESPQAVNAVWAARLKNQGATSTAAPVEQAAADTASTPDAITPAHAEVVVPAAVARAASSPAAVARPAGRRFQLVSPAMAEPAPLLSRSARTAAAHTPAETENGGGWGIQVGAFSSAALAQQATVHARSRASGNLVGAHVQVATVRAPHGQLYRARLVGLSRADALAACRRLDSGSSDCVVVSPDSSR